MSGKFLLSFNFLFDSFADFHLESRHLEFHSGIPPWPVETRTEMNPIVSAGGLSSGLEGSHVCELFSDDPRDPSGVRSRPKFGLGSVPSLDCPRISFNGAGGRRKTLEFQTEFLLPCELGEAISWAGASAVHVGGGIWNVCAPGTAVEPHWLGDMRASVVVEFVSLVRSLWPLREAVLKPISTRGVRP